MNTKKILMIVFIIAVIALIIWYISKPGMYFNKKTKDLYLWAGFRFVRFKFADYKQKQKEIIKGKYSFAYDNQTNGEIIYSISTSKGSLLSGEIIYPKDQINVINNTEVTQQQTRNVA